MPERALRDSTVAMYCRVRIASTTGTLVVKNAPTLVDIGLLAPNELLLSACVCCTRTERSPSGPMGVL